MASFCSTLPNANFTSNNVVLSFWTHKSKVKSFHMKLTFLHCTVKDAEHYYITGKKPFYLPSLWTHECCTQVILKSTNTQVLK